MPLGLAKVFSPASHSPPSPVPTLHHPHCLMTWPPLTWVNTFVFVQHSSDHLDFGSFKDTDIKLMLCINLTRCTKFKALKCSNIKNLVPFNVFLLCELNVLTLEICQEIDSHLLYGGQLRAFLGNSTHLSLLNLNVCLNSYGCLWFVKSFYQ